MTDKSSLREELNMPEAPDFEIELPPGWSRREVTPETLVDFTSSIKHNLMRAHQPQKYATMERLLRDAFDGMRQAGAFAFFAPIDPPEDAPMMSASILARIRRSQDGQSLDALARTLIRSHSATPLMGDARTLRYEEEKQVRIETETFVNHSITYLTPVPGAGRRRALELVASLVRPIATPKDAPRFVAQINLMDLCAASLRWSGGPVGTTGP